MELLKHKTNINFLRWAGVAAIVSTVLVAASVYIWLALGPKKFGIDFRGGYSFVVKIAEKANSEAIANALETHGVHGASVQAFEAGSNDYSIRSSLVEGMDSKTMADRVRESLRSLYNDKFEIVQSDAVGATIGGELKRRAIWATLLGVIAVLVYIAFRFEFSFSLGAVVAMFHDVIVATGAYLWMGYELNGAALAAALTIVGYSVNDTIVIYDRVREEMHKRKGAALRDLLNESNNFCLSRTIITGTLTLFAVLALYLYGGGAIQDLSFFLLIGMLSGIYSTIYIAGPVTLLWDRLVNKRAAA